MENREYRYIYYDSDLEIEVYKLRGIVQKFPNHFHDCYVFGVIEGGQRKLWCKGKEYQLTKGDLIIFNPSDNHYCEPTNKSNLDYRAVNINLKTMLRFMENLTGKAIKPYFLQNVIYKCDKSQILLDLYETIITRKSRLCKEKALENVLSKFVLEYASNCGESTIRENGNQITAICDYIESHYWENISLDDLVGMTDFGKSYFLRYFTKQVGVSPYRYIQTVRINKSKKLLEDGVLPVDVAIITGFSDQSHFTNFFKAFIGLTPKQYQKIFLEET